MTDMTRRRFLTVGAGTAVGTAGVESVDATRVASSFSSPGLAKHSPGDLDHIEERDVRQVRNRLDDIKVVDGVADLGLDTTGQQPVDEKIRAAAERGEIVTIPPGDYLFSSTVSTSASGWGIVGTGETPRDVRLHGEGNMVLVEQRGGADVRIANLAMVNGTSGEVATNPYNGRGPPRGSGLKLILADGLDVQNIEHIGVSPREGVSGDHEEFNHQTGSLTIQITNHDGVGVVDGFRKTSPTEISGHAENDAAFNSWGQHEGTCYVRNSTVHNGGGDGCTYVSRCPGAWRFTNCAFKYHTMSGIRAGGGDSWARRCTIVLDVTETRARNNILDDLNPGSNGIVWESASSVAPGGRNEAGGLIDGCEIVMRAVNGSRGGIVVDGSNGGLVIRNTRIVNHTDQPSINVEAPGSSHMNDFEIPDGPLPVYLRNVTLTGRGSGPAINGERGVVGTNVTVSMPNAGVTGDVSLGARGQPGFATELLSLQGPLPRPVQSLGASGTVAGPIPGGAANGRGGSRIGGAVVAIGAAVSGIALLVVALAAVTPVLLFSYLLD